MGKKGNIKVIKKGDAVVRKPKAVKTQRAVAREAAREMVSTVSEWVVELKERKSAETKAAIDMLFNSPQRPSES